MRRLVVPIIALGALALPAAAPAKDVRSATVCGPDACATTRDRPALRALLEGNAPGAPPAAAAPFYTVRYRMGPDGSYTVQWLPDQGLVRSADPDPVSPTWVRPDPEGLVLLSKIADGLRPFPAAELGPLRPTAGAGSLPPEVVAPAAAARGEGGGDGGGGLPAGALVGVGAALLAALLLVLLGRRRRRQRGIAAGLTVLAVAALLPAVSASAKELSAAELCDTQRCIGVRDRPTVESLADASMLTGPPAVAGKPYLLRFHVTHEGEDVASWSATWYPEAGVVQTTGDTGAPRYYEPMFPARAALDQLTGRLRGESPGGRGDTGGGVPWPAWAALAALLAAGAGAAVRRSRAVPRGRRAAAPHDAEGPSLAS